jgi:hypothetical protein
MDAAVAFGAAEETPMPADRRPFDETASLASRGAAWRESRCGQAAVDEFCSRMRPASFPQRRSAGTAGDKVSARPTSRRPIVGAHHAAAGVAATVIINIWPEQRILMRAALADLANLA